MLKGLKKIIAGISAIVIMATTTSCGADTKWVLQYGDYEARAGIFLYYQMSAYYDAINTIQEENENFDTSDTKALKSATVEDTPIVDWIQNQATERTEVYLEVLKQFDELGLELTEDELSYIDTLTEYYWQYYSETYTQNGIGEQSFKDINTYSYKLNKVFDYYYAEGGVEEIPEQDLKDYYDTHNARVKYICLNSTDTNGSFLSDEMKSMAEDFLKRANSGESFDDLIQEYEDYKTQLAEEQAEADAETDTTEDTGTIESESVSESNEVEEVEVLSTDEEIDNQELSTNNEDDTSETEDLTIGESETTTEVTAETEEEDPYPNEYIISLSEDETGTSGSPTYKVNQEIFAQSNFGTAFLVEEDNAYYVVVRYDIWERDDLWTDDTKSSIRSTLKSDEFNEKMLSSVDTGVLTKNNKAYTRYNPFDMKF